MTCGTQSFQVAVGSDGSYTLDWAGASKLVTGEIITSSTWSEDSGDLTLHGGTFTDTAATTFANGGLYGRVYEIFNTVVTSTGRTDVWGMKLHFTHILKSAY